MNSQTTTAASGEELLVGDHLRPQRRAIDARTLRYLLALTIRRAGRAMTVAELVRAADAEGFVLSGRPSKTVSDALRSPVARGWVRRIARGRYAPGHMAKSTVHRQQRWVDAVRRGLDPWTTR